MLDTFAALLESEDFLLASGLVAGLILREDLDGLTATALLEKGAKKK